MDSANEALLQERPFTSVTCFWAGDESIIKVILNVCDALTPASVMKVFML